MRVDLFAKNDKDQTKNKFSSMMQAGIDKKSFAMYFGGGEIWFEHLDGMYGLKDQVIEKFTKDLPKITRVSAPSLIAVNLDQTRVDSKIIDLISGSFIDNEAYIHKVVFVGLDNKARKSMIIAFKKRKSDYHFSVNYINDFEKAKEWLVNR